MSSSQIRAGQSLPITIQLADAAADNVVVDPTGAIVTTTFEPPDGSEAVERVMTAAGAGDDAVVRTILTGAELSPRGKWWVDGILDQSGLLDDAARRGHVVTLVAADGVTYGVPSRLGNGTGLALDGSQGAATFAPIDLDAALTFEAWLTPGQQGGNGNGVILGGADNRVYLVDGASGFVHLRALFGADFSNTTPLAIGQRYHLVISIDDDGNGTFYVNGIADGTFTRPSGPTGALTVTQMFFDALQSIEPLIAALVADVVLYSTALTSDQVAAHYALRFGTNSAYVAAVLAHTPIAYWRLAEPAFERVFPLKRFSFMVHE